MNTATETLTTVKLQTIGQQCAKLVEHVQVGDVLVWNGGATTEVVTIVQLSAKFVNIVQRSTGDRCFHSRRMKLDRHVGFSPKLTATNLSK